MSATESFRPYKSILYNLNKTNNERCVRIQDADSKVHFYCNICQEQCGTESTLNCKVGFSKGKGKGKARYRPGQALGIPGG